MIRPYCWKLSDYIESMLCWCECQENKDKTFYYFKITKQDIIKEMELVKRYFERDIPVVKILLRLEEKKKMGIDG